MSDDPASALDRALRPARAALRVAARGAGRLARGARRPVVAELGAGTHIPSVRWFSHTVIHARGGRLVPINPRESAVPTRLDAGLALGAREALLAIDARLAALHRS